MNNSVVSGFNFVSVMATSKYTCAPTFILFFWNSVLIFAFQEIQPVIIMRDLNEGHTVVGGTTRLECKTTFNSSYIAIKWFVRGDPVNTNLIEEQVLSSQTCNSSYITVSRWTKQNTDITDKGVYTCQAEHKERSNYKFKDELPLLLWDTKRITLSFGQIDKFRNAVLELAVYIRAHPNITSVTWVHKGNKTVITNPPAQFPIQNESPNKQSNYYVRFPFQTLTVQDFGEYTVTAKNNFATETISFLVDLSNETIINLTYDHIDENARIATYKCEVVSFPKKSVSWIFKKYNYTEIIMDNLARSGTKLTESKFEENGLKVTSYVSLNSSETGLLECHVGAFSKGLDVFHVQNGFDIFAKGMIKNSNGTNIVYARYKQPGILFCVVSLLNYTNKLSWYTFFNDELIEKYYVDTYVKPYLTVQTGKYYILEERNFTCEAISRTGAISSKSVEVIPKRIPSLYPHIIMQDTKQGHTIQGELLEITCKIVYYDKVEIKWYFLNGTWQLLDTDESIGQEFDSTDSYAYITTSKFSTMGSLSTAGFYRCGVFPSRWEEIWVPVYDTRDNSIKFDNKTSVFDRTKNEIKVFLNAHPEPTILWFDNNGAPILTSLISTEYTSKSGGNNYVTRFSNLTDTGKYTVIALNKYRNKTFSVVANVTGIPTSRMEIHEFSGENTTIVIKCSSIGYPQPEIRWYFRKCDTLVACMEVNKVNGADYGEIKELRHQNHKFETISYISVNLSEPGIVRCFTTNSLGSNHTDEPIFYVKNNFDIFVKDATVQHSDKTVEVVSGEQLTIMCAFSITDYMQEIEWSVGNYHQSLEESNISAVYKIHTFKFLLMYVSVLDITLTENLGPHTCCALTKDGLIRRQRIYVTTKDKDKLVIRKTNMGSEPVEVNVGDTWKFQCEVKGFPTPVIKWLKDHHALQESEKIKVFNNGQELEIGNINIHDEAEYTCQVSNRFEKLTAKQILTIKRKFQKAYVTVPVAVVVALAVVTIFVHYMKLRKENSLLSELKAADLMHFQEGNLQNLNPEIGIEEQANLLPYDTRLEIPFDNIRLDKQLGSGAFGVVFRAEVTNYFPGEHQKTTAIKTTDPTSGFESVKNLASELKIMSHLGKHLNIVNLLGACTKNIVKKQLYVVVEYCEFGNLQDYIRRRSKNFIDQKNYEVDEFVWTTVTDADDDIDIDETANTVYYSNTAMCSKDLLIWAFQVCSGMDYLGSRRIVHGDLAARNILLTGDNVVKIADFGLSKKIYQDNYVKKGKGLLPVKWMAVEAIEKGIFSIQSDIWAFGVVLWEFFSLGGTPYPALIVDEDFLERLVSGYRMRSPKAATIAIYDIMLECWSLDPLLRPAFASLIEKIGCILDDSTKNYYINMNKGYTWMDGRLEQEDYLAMISPPTFENVAGCSRSNLDHEYVNTSYVPDVTKIHEQEHGQNTYLNA